MDIVILLQFIQFIVLGYIIYTQEDEKKKRLDFQIRMEEKWREFISHFKKKTNIK